MRPHSPTGIQPPTLIAQILRWAGLRRLPASTTWLYLIVVSIASFAALIWALVSTPESSLQWATDDAKQVALPPSSVPPLPPVVVGEVKSCLACTVAFPQGLAPCRRNASSSRLLGSGRHEVWVRMLWLRSTHGQETQASFLSDRKGCQH